MLDRLDKVERKSMIAAWRAAIDGGLAIDYVEDGELAMSSAPTLEGPAFNHASGFVKYPNLIDTAYTFYDKHQSPGWLWLDESPWPGAEAETTVNVHAADPLNVPDAPGPAGLTVRIIGRDDASLYSNVHGTTAVTSGLIDPTKPNPWHVVYERLARWSHPTGLADEIADHQDPAGTRRSRGYRCLRDCPAASGRAVGFRRSPRPESSGPRTSTHERQIRARGPSAPTGRC